MRRSALRRPRLSRQPAHHRRTRRLHPCRSRSGPGSARGRGASRGRAGSRHTRKLLRNLPLELAAVGSVSGHGFHPSKARRTQSIHSDLTVRPERPTRPHFDEANPLVSQVSLIKACAVDASPSDESKSGPERDGKEPAPNRLCGHCAVQLLN